MPHAGPDRATVVKEQRVIASPHELLAAGAAEPFVPAGRRFRQWAAVPPQRVQTWSGLLDEALRFACG